MAKIRLLPVLILTAALTLVLKIEAVVVGVGDFDIAPAVAQTKPAKTSAAVPAETEAAVPAKTENTPAATPTKAAALQAPSFTRAELDVLQSLAQRREALDKQAKDVAMRDGVLKAMEQRIDEKIVQLKALEARIEKILRQHDVEEEAQLKSLVKVYEAMKPKEAAKIFNELELSILIEVTGRMREAKAAAILARMTPSLARELTVELATRRQLPKLGG